MIGLLLLLNRTGITRVHFVFSHEILLRQAKEDFYDLWTMAGLDGRVQHHVGLDFTPRNGDFIIIDEADSFIYDDLKRFTAFSKRAKIVCLTGLVHERGTHSAEGEVIRHLDVKVFDDSKLEPSTQDILHGIQDRDFSSFERRLAYIRAERQKQSVLWHCEKAFKAYLLEQGIAFLDLDAIEDAAVLRALDETVDGQYRLLVCTNVEPSLRGVDYRSPMAGVLMIFT